MRAPKTKCWVPWYSLILFPLNECLTKGMIVYNVQILPNAPLSFWIIIKIILSPTETSTKVQSTEGTEDKTDTTDKTGKLPWYIKVMWFMQYQIYPGLVMTTVARWAVDTGIPYNYATNVIDIHHHGVGILLLVIDFFLLASPFRLQHILFAPILPFIYVIFTVIYYFAGGTNEHHLFEERDGNTYIYREHFDWGMYPWTTVVTCVLTIFVAYPCWHFIFYLLRKLRDTCIEWCQYNKATQ